MAVPLRCLPYLSGKFSCVRHLGVGVDVCLWWNCSRVGDVGILALLI